MLIGHCKLFSKLTFRALICSWLWALKIPFPRISPLTLWVKRESFHKLKQHARPAVCKKVIPYLQQFIPTTARGLHLRDFTPLGRRFFHINNI